MIYTIKMYKISKQMRVFFFVAWTENWEDTT